MTARLATVLVVVLGLTGVFVPHASAALGDDFGVTEAAGAAWPGAQAFWAGACDLEGASTSNGGVGVPPGSFAHCIDHGRPYIPPFGDPDPDPPRETTWEPGGEPSWRLDPYAQAGGHPDTTLSFWMRRSPVQRENSGIPFSTDGDTKTIVTKLPAGIAGNPQAVPQCPSSALRTVPPTCPPETQVGVSTVSIGVGGPTGIVQYVFPVWNVEPRDGKTAELMISAGDIAGRANIPIVARVRSDDDYGIDALAINLPGGVPLFGQTITLWGVPWAASHDKFRPVTQYQGHLDEGVARAGMPESGLSGGTQDLGGAPGIQSQEPQSYQPSWGPIQPFMTNPTECSPVKAVTRLELDSWQDPGIFRPFGAVADATIGGCPAVPFDPSVAIQPTTQAADSPSGLDVTLDIPQNNDPPADVATEPDDDTGAPAHWKSASGLATSHMRDAVATLPEGVSVNPSAANGQLACSPAQIGLTSSSPIRFNGAPVACPDASKLGTVVAETPLLDPVDYPTGSVYVATQNDNPFNSLVALYMVLDSPRRGLTVKLAGKADLDPVTGRITTAFRQNPQLPVSRFVLRFKGGPLAPLATPVTCGTGLTSFALTPYSDPGSPVTIAQPFPITSGPNGTACPAGAAARPFGLGFSAGTESPVAGAHSPFRMRLTRPDGAQEVDRIEVTTPKGLSATLAGVPYCSEAAIAAAGAPSRTGRAELASPSCPAASRIGTTTVGAGAGSQPFYTGGSMYLAGPYKGAPLSLAIMVPAVAGPFDLGTVVVRTALHVNPRSAQITAISDPLPRILHGIPLRVRDIRVDIDRPGFTLNPTDCSEQLVTGKVFGSHGALSDVSNRFQVAECTRLPFKPKLTFRLKGGTKRGKHPQFTATVWARPGDANIARVAAALPRSEFLENAHIRTICTRPDFAADNCPKGAIYGHATAWSPLLDEPLTGPVYLRSSDNLLPDLVPDLRGPAHQPIKVELAGRTDSIRGGIRNTFDIVPDAPVSRFVLRMQGGKKGLLVNSRDICRRTYRAKVDLTAHNGKAHTIRPKLVARGCKKAKKRKAKRGGHKRGR